MSVCGIVLAAGEGTRMGDRVKQLLPLRGVPLLQHPIDAAAAAGILDLRIVLGHRAEEVAAAIEVPPGGEIVVNPRYAEGQSTSLRAGLDAAPEGSRAAVILLGDQPEVRVEAIRAVIDWHWVHGSPMVRAAYRGRPAHPVLLARSAWAGVEVLRGDVGARALEATHLGRADVAEVGGDPPEDVDAPEDYARLLARAGDPGGEAAAGPRLHMERTLPAPPAAVFDAFATPKTLARWWGPHGFTAPSIDMDLRAGGRYRIAMQPPDGDLFHLRGEFREVDPPRRLGFTFEWEEPHPDDRPTVVTLSFEPRGDSTRATLDQGPFATEERRALHDAGWTDTFERLAELLSAPGPSAA